VRAVSLTTAGEAKAEWLKKKLLSTHADRKVWIYRLLFVFLCVLVWLRIFPPRVKLAVSNFARQFIGVHFVNFAPPEAQNWMNQPGHGLLPPTCRHYHRDALT